jgi:hypothetical protein
MQNRSTFIPQDCAEIKRSFTIFLPLTPEAEGKHPSFGTDVEHFPPWGGEKASNSKHVPHFSLAFTLQLSQQSFATATMALKHVTRPLLQQSRAFSPCQRLPRPSVVRCPFDFFPARRRVAHCRPARSAFIAGQRRAFSNTLRTRYAQVEDAIDPRDQPRESDEVDVCIVGGGKPTAR